MRPHVTTSPSLSPARIGRRQLFGLMAGALAAATLVGLSPLPARAEPAPFTVMDAQTAHEKAKAGEVILVDIRTPPEWAQTGIGDGALPLDMTAPDFVTKLVKLRQDHPETPIALICRTGNRSDYAVSELARQGFPGLVDVKEGMAGGPNGQGWIPRGLPTYEASPENIKAHLEPFGLAN